MSKQTLIDELTKEVSQAKSTYQECTSNLSKRIFETKIRAYSHALDLANYHIRDGKESVDINHIESAIMNVINDFTVFIKPSHEANAFVFDMLKQKICFALQEYNLNGGWISVDDGLPEPEIDCSRDFEPTKFYLIQLKSGLIEIVAFVNIYYDADDNRDEFVVCTINSENNKYVVQEYGQWQYDVDEVKYWQPMPKPPKE